jgi:glutaminyl-peptide cyclotransferase
MRIAASALVGAAFVLPATVSAQDAESGATCPSAALEPVGIVRRMPHDPRAFTQGLLWHRGALYESTGQPGQSGVRRVNAATGKVQARRAIPPPQFGEGLARIGNELVMLTWHDGIAYRFAADTLKAVGQFRYKGEGWGLTSDGKRYIRSDGSDTLFFHDPATFEETGRVRVTLAGTPIDQINELEWIDGLVYANVWHADIIVAIDPASGCIVRRLDLRPLVASVGVTDSEAVLNGIAWDEAGKRLYVTGKNWPALFEISLPPRR